MNLTTWTSIACVVLATYYWNQLRRMQTRLSHSLLTGFGSTKVSLSEIQHKVIIEECIAQNRRAFALVCSAVVLGIILSTVVVGFFVLSRQVTIASLSSLAGLVSDFSLAGSALQLYRASNKHLEKALSAANSGDITMNPLLASNQK